MEVKTFEAFTMKDAIRSVKKEFGNDAIILSTKEVESRDGRSKMYEVRASPSGASYRSVTESRGMVVGASTASADEDSGEGYRRELLELNRRVARLEENGARRQDLDGIEASLLELRNLLSELLSSRDGSIFEGLDEDTSQLLSHLKMMDVNEADLLSLGKYLNALPQESYKKELPRMEVIKAHAIRWFLKRIRIAPIWNSVMGERQLQVFVGPTGVGKSTTVAKLAAHFQLKEDRRVVILSYDTNRLGATEQMRIYAKVIGCPFESVSRLSEIQSAIDRHLDKDIIILDTAGRSPKNRHSLEDLSELKKLNIAVYYHLVLSMTDRRLQVERSIKGFSSLGVNSLVFTKLDESWAYGEVYNASMKWGIPLSYFGIGQKIPEDLERASKERVVERLFSI